MGKRGERIGLAGLSLALSICATAQAVAAAQLTFYPTRSAWSAAVGGNYVIDFEGLERPGGYSGIAVPPGLTVSGVNFSMAAPTSGDDFILAGPVGYGPSSVLAFYDSAFSTRVLVIKIPEPGFAGIAFDLGRTVIPRDVTVTLSTGDSFQTTASFPLGFVGFTSSAPITQIAISEPRGTNVILLDNVSFALGLQPPLPTGPPTAIPALIDWMLVVLAAALAATAGFLLRRSSSPRSSSS